MFDKMSNFVRYFGEGTFLTTVTCDQANYFALSFTLCLFVVARKIPQENVRSVKIWPDRRLGFRYLRGYLAVLRHGFGDPQCSLSKRNE